MTKSKCDGLLLLEGFHVFFTAQTLSDPNSTHLQAQSSSQIVTFLVDSTSWLQV